MFYCIEKQKRLKQAKDEAASEIELFKSQEDRKYMEHERQVPFYNFSYISVLVNLF